MEFVEKVAMYLKIFDYQLASLEIMNPDNLKYIQAEGMDLISKLCDIGLQEAVEFDDISSCSELLNYICNCYNPKLALVSTLEQAETFILSPKFTIILKAMQIVFIKHPSKRAATYSWTLNLLNKHLKEFHKFPEEFNNKLTEAQESLLLENDSRIRNIFIYYSDVSDFYVPILNEFVTQKQYSLSNSDVALVLEIGKQERILKACLVNLLGQPLIYFDLTWSPEAESKNPKPPRKNRSRLQLKKPPMQTQILKSEGRLISEKVTQMISRVNIDKSFLLKWTERKCTQQPPPLTDFDEIEYDEELEEEEVQIQRLALANYFYLIYVEDLSSDQIPMTYTTNHLFCVLFPLVNDLLIEGHQNYLVIQKGLLLAQKLIGQLSESLGAEFIRGKIYSTFVERLAEIIIFSESKLIRQLGLSVMKDYFWVFDAPGKYMFFQFILVKVHHSGLVGYLIGQVKECIANALNGDGGDNQQELQKQFLGDNLSKLMLQICVLKDGAATDLMESNDKIIAVLNLLRFLLLRDGVQNESGILKEMSKINALLLKPLRTGLDLTKAHYKLKLKEIEEPGYKGNKTKEISSTSEVDMNIIIGGKEVNVGDVPIEEQMKVINSALLNMDIMESLLVRVNECYSSVASK